ncbi:unnamed protein product [Rotaria sp. Silwood2]|nr:unnamed protein product [Rotaria sp. Silwood2]
MVFHKILGSYNYSPGNYVADAISIVTCTTDSAQYSIYAAKKKLPQCHDDFNSYVHIEYGYIPILMNDSINEYNLIDLKEGGCSSSNGTIISAVSPVQNFQLCRGPLFTLQYPNNYGLVIRINIFGTTQSNPISIQKIKRSSSCSNKITVYQYVEYQCIPTNTELISPNVSCSIDGSKILVQIDHRGRLPTYKYRSFTIMNCIYRLISSENSIMNFCALDISLNDYPTDCRSNKITFIQDGIS